MNNDNGPTEFERRARAVLRDSADSLDGATRSRLTQARHVALAQVGRTSGWRDLRVIVPGAAVAAGLLMALLFWSGHGPALPGGGGSSLDDIELLADAEAYELSQEPDLEFIEWAAAVGDGPAGT